MRTWRWLAVLAVILGLGGLLYYYLRPRPLPPREIVIRAEMTRPDTVDPAASEFRIQVNGQEWLGEQVEVRCDQPIELELTFPPRESQRDIRGFFLAPRLAEHSEEGFEWIDFGCDRFVDLDFDYGRDPQHQHPIAESFTWKLAPGEYRVRFFLRTFTLDLENEPPPRVTLMGEGRLRVLPSETGGECDKQPLEERLVRAYVPE